MTIFKTRRTMTGIFGLAAMAAACLPGVAFADRIKHPTAVFSGLDKITGRIISFDAAIDETVQFGALQVTARVCYTRPATEAPQTTTFIEVDDVGNGQPADYKRIFSGWMYAASPGLHGVEHPVYDIWLTDCKGGKDIIKDAPDVAEQAPEEPLREGPRSRQRAGQQPLPGQPGAPAGQPIPGQPLPGQPLPGQPLQPLPGQPQPGQPAVARSGGPIPPGLIPGQSLPPPVAAQPRQPSRSFFPVNPGAVQQRDFTNSSNR